MSKFLVNCISLCTAFIGLNLQAEESQEQSIVSHSLPTQDESINIEDLNDTLCEENVLLLGVLDTDEENDDDEEEDDDELRKAFLV